MSNFKVEVQADSTGTWAGNALTFDTVDDAEAYARDLWSRWTAVREWRVVAVGGESATALAASCDLDKASGGHRAGAL